MTSATKAFGRSLPRDMQEERAQQLIAAGQQQLLSPTQLWKVNDEKAGKSGPCQAVYWVKERPVTTELTRHSKTGGAGDKQWQTGSVYKGEWKSNRKHGYGIQLYANGNKYEGEWANGNREGHGVFWLKEKVSSKSEEEKTNSSAASSSSSASSAGKKAAPVKKLRRVYAGNWKDDLKHGVGVYFYPDGSRYEGNWVSDQRSGRGTLYFPNGDSYTGSWLADAQNGFGTLTKKNKDVYEGEWVQGKREGSGIYYYKQQEKIYDGEWVNDQPKCGVYTDAKEFFDDAEEERRYAAAQGGQRLGRDGKPLSAAEQAQGLSAAAQQASPDVVSPRVPRAAAHRPIPIPRLRMADADAVLADAIEQVNLERAPVRALPTTALSELFNSTSLDALRRLFASYDHNLETGDGSGRVSVKHLRAMLAELGLPALDDPTFSQLCTDLRLEKGAKNSLSFDAFVRAVHIREEARSFEQQQQQRQQQDE